MSDNESLRESEEAMMQDGEGVPDILEGYYQVKFYGYSLTFQEAMAAALNWMGEHPEYDVEDVVIGSDEGTWVSLYCRKQ